MILLLQCQKAGIPGGICSVQYYDKPIEKSTIDLEYSSLKHKTPPII